MFKKFTLEELIPSDSTLDGLKTFSKRQRKALYLYLTYLAYRCDHDPLRKALYEVRKELLYKSRSDNNHIEEDKISKNPIRNLLPDALKR
tara:strand:- start:239 stop:508 length:270 start_codon:yes stop_codon:yes gene_type:complete